MHDYCVWHHSCDHDFKRERVVGGLAENRVFFCLNDQTGGLSFSPYDRITHVMKGSWRDPVLAFAT